MQNARIDAPPGSQGVGNAPVLERSSRCIPIASPGSRVASEIELPGAIPAQHAGTPDVMVRAAPVPASLDDAGKQGVTWQIAGDRFLFQVPGVARFLLSGGREILFEPASGVAAGDVSIFLIGTVFGILLHQRGEIVLHASAVQVNGKAVLFCGSSGAGKSTLAAALAQRGFPLVADDLCAITLAAGAAPMVQPDGRHLKLWAQAIEKLDLAEKRGALVRNRLEKFFVEPMGALAEPPCRSPCHWAPSTRCASAAAEQIRYRAPQCGGCRAHPAARRLSPADGQPHGAEGGLFSRGDGDRQRGRDFPSHARPQFRRHAGGGRHARTALARHRPDGEGGMTRTVWLASYPKSGNTWLRMLIANLSGAGRSAGDINDLPERGGIASARGPFDYLTLIDFGLLTHDEVDCLRPRVYEELANGAQDDEYDEPAGPRRCASSRHTMPIH